MVTPSLRLVRELGVGGMGHVWVADHLVLGVPVAVKFLAPELTFDPNAIARFSREAVAASEVRSPHVVQILDYGVSDDGPPYLVMELLEGCDLAQLLRRNRTLPLAKVAHIVGQVANALARAHERGVVHRDVKPGNIFLTDPDAAEPFVKVLDFGIAKNAATDATMTATGAALGTVHYMSPEQIVAKPVDHRTDVWSLGVVVFEALTGTVPFDGGSVGSLALALHTQPFPLLSRRAPSLGTGLDDWMKKACAREPSDRFGSMDELAWALSVSLGPAEPSRVVHVDADARAEGATVIKAVARSAGTQTGECLVAPADPPVPLRAVRSTTISSSLRAIEQRGLLPTYFRALPEEHHGAIRALVVGEWLPLSLASEHYAALDQLGLSPLEIVAIGRDVAARLHGSFLATLVTRLASSGIVTPWAVFKLFPRPWARAFDGGSLACWKLGDREARIEAHAFPIARHAYVRHAMRGNIVASLEVMLNVKSYVQLVPALTNDTTLAYRVAWS